MEKKHKDTNIYEIENNRLVRNGEDVAVLYSPGRGAGWSTWNYSYSECMFCPELARLVLVGADYSELLACAESLYPDASNVGLSDLRLVWLKKGTNFYIDEYEAMSKSMPPCRLYICSIKRAYVAETSSRLENGQVAWGGAVDETSSRVHWEWLMLLRLAASSDTWRTN